MNGPVLPPMALSLKTASESGTEVSPQWRVRTRDGQEGEQVVMAEKSTCTLVTLGAKFVLPVAQTPPPSQF